MSLYCPNCKIVVTEGESSCPRCFASSLACLGCHQVLPAGSNVCPSCVRKDLATIEETSASMAVSTVPMGARMPLAVERYQAGKFGVQAEVTVPAVDVAIMNELGRLVELLHAMATRANQFVGMTDHTRKVIRDMRVLATDLQEEIEMRRGPLG